jgi:hypothetical protein
MTRADRILRCRPPCAGGTAAGGASRPSCRGCRCRGDPADRWRHGDDFSGRGLVAALARLHLTQRGTGPSGNMVLRCRTASSVLDAARDSAATGRSTRFGPAFMPTASPPACPLDPSPREHAPKHRMRPDDEQASAASARVRGAAFPWPDRHGAGASGAFLAILPVSGLWMIPRGQPWRSIRAALPLPAVSATTPVSADAGPRGVATDRTAPDL